MGTSDSGANTSYPQPTPTSGAWQPAAGGGWTWVPGATPDPSLASQWGPGALTNPIQAPDGELNHGSWIPVTATNAPAVTGGSNNGQPNANPTENSGTGWIWEWGATPSASQISQYGDGSLTNPNKDPSGGEGVINQPTQSGLSSPGPDDVTPPQVTDTWGGHAPDLTGGGSWFPPTGNGSSGPPPTVQPFLVSPGSIRYQEVLIINANDEGTSDYEDLVNFISWAKQQNLGDSGTVELLGSTMDNLAYDYSNFIALVGSVLSLLNITAQNYTKADMDSAFSQFPGVPNVNVPGNYDDASYVIHANPDLMYQLSQFMLSFAEGAGNNVNNIVNKWNSLNNSNWMGATASAAEALMDSVNQAVTALMGPSSGNNQGTVEVTSNGQNQGVFPDTINALSMAAGNYAYTEQNNTSNWQSFAAGLAPLPAPTANQQGEASDVQPTVKPPGNNPDDPFSEVTPT
jgi:hypothetical protein